MGVTKRQRIQNSKFVRGPGREGASSRRSPRRAMLAGFDLQLAKPVDPAELVAVAV